MNDERCKKNISEEIAQEKKRFYDSLAEQVSKHRQESNYTREALAKQSDITVEFIQELEEGRYRDTYLDLLCEIAHHLGKQCIAKMVSKEEPPPQKKKITSLPKTEP